MKSLCTLSALVIVGALAACDPAPVESTSLDLGRTTPPAPARAARAPAASPAAYFGEEYADAQRALLDRVETPPPPTF